MLAELAALLHDVGRTQPGPEDEHGARSAALAEPLLASLPLACGDRRAVLHAVHWHNSPRSDTPLLRVLRDADMLDGLGAIGIMRAFMSKSHLPPYDPAAPFQVGNVAWTLSTCSDQILVQRSWLDRLHTDTARRTAQTRAAFMDAFLEQAQQELVTTDNGQKQNGG
jgi:HD superfamily phosphodiesterase